MVFVGTDQCLTQQLNRKVRMSTALCFEHRSESALEPICAAVNTPFLSPIYVLLTKKATCRVIRRRVLIPLNRHKGAAFIDSLSSGCFYNKENMLHWAV